MAGPPKATSTLLETSGLQHGFFSRHGGASEGVYATLNVGGLEDPQVAENRKRCAASLGVEAGKLVILRQIHSATALVIDGPLAVPPEGDGMATRSPGLALGIVTADCMPVLFADPEAGVIGAAHAGWRGALNGILENTIEAMAQLGADSKNIRAAIGPAIRQQNFEVGMDLVETFVEKFPQAEKFFAPGISSEKRQFDLAGFGVWRMREAGLRQIDDIDQCTLAAPDDYFSYRAMKREGHADNGRNLSAIALT